MDSFVVSSPVGSELMAGGANTPRCYVSYAWADEGDPHREAQVDALCEQAKKNGVEIVRDKDALKAGDRISDFMRRIGGGDRVFVFLSDKYLTSPFCMNELFQMWKNSREDPEDFLRRVRLFTLDDAKFSKIIDRIRYAEYWQQEHDKLADVLKGKSPTLLSEADYRSFRLMDDFAAHIGDILALFSDTVRPRSFDEFLKYGFDDPTQQATPVEPPAQAQAPPMRPTPSPVGPRRSKGLLASALAVLVVVAAAAGSWAVLRNWQSPTVAPNHGNGSVAPPPSPETAWCYQEHKSNGPYFVACHKQQADCAKERGENNPTPGTNCQPVDLSKAAWAPSQGGLLGSQYSTSSTPFPTPFPQIDEPAPFDKAQYLVFIQFAGYNQPDIQKLADKLSAQAWNVQKGLDRQASAAGLSEVRYHDVLQKVPAETLAAAINATGIVTTPVKAVAVAPVHANVLEVWVGQRQ